MRTPLACALAAVLALAGCGSDGKWLPPDPPTVEVTMRDYRFEHPRSVREGRVNFRVVNAGRVEHDLALIPLPEDFPPIAEQLRGGTRRVVNTLAGVPALRPGQRDTFAVDLEPSRYALISFILDADGVSQARKGMASEFRVR